MSALRFVTLYWSYTRFAVLLNKDKCNKKSFILLETKTNLWYTCVITPKPVTSGGAHHRDLAPVLHYTAPRMIATVTNCWRFCVHDSEIEPKTFLNDSDAYKNCANDWPFILLYFNAELPQAKVKHVLLFSFGCLFVS